MLPGILTWSTLILIILVTFIKPLWMVYFIIVFDLYWMLKVIYISTFLVISFRKYRVTLQRDWPSLAGSLPGYENTYQLIMLPNASEDRQVIDTTLQSLANSTFPKERTFIIFAAEERFASSIENAHYVKDTYGDQFGAVEIAIHPADIPHELAGKGANLTWAIQQLQGQVIDARNIPYENVIVSVFDIDTCVEPQYFDYLTYTYLTHPNRTRASYQPIPMFNNNIWDAPAIMRVASSGTTFWLMGEQARPERLFTFSSHSMPLKALIDVGYWETDITSDDSRIFLQCFLHYDGDYEVVPLHMPVYMDAVLSPTWRKSLKNLYKQQRRWAWGSENIPYMLWHFWKNSAIPLRKRLYHLFNQIEGMWSWGTASLIIFIGGYLPLFLVNPTEQGTVVAHNAPFVLQIILTVANIGIIVSVILGTLILPSRPTHHKPRKYAMMILPMAATASIYDTIWIYSSYRVPN